MCYINFDCFDKNKVDADIATESKPENSHGRELLENADKLPSVSGAEKSTIGKAMVAMQRGKNITRNVMGKGHNFMLYGFTGFSNHTPKAEYSFGNYAARFWIHHIQVLQLEPPSADNPDEEDWWALFRSLAIDKERRFIHIQPRVWEDKNKQFENWVERKKSPRHARLFKWAIDTGSILLLRLLIQEKALTPHLQRQQMLRYDSPILYLIDNNFIEAAIVIATEIGKWTVDEQAMISNDLGKSLLFALVNAVVRIWQPEIYGIWDWGQTTRLVEALLM